MRALASQTGRARTAASWCAAAGLAARQPARWRAAGSAAAATEQHKQRLVFLGTPEVAAIVLQELLAASQEHGSSFNVVGVVCQPGKPKGRGNKGQPVPSPVEQLARAQLPPETPILCPKSAREPAFLQALAALQPDLAVTAAYGNMLPAAFLALPKHGTLNIHPSLLPAYRGAAPVQRALQDGVPSTGVSVAFTVLACDAGPVLAQEAVSVPPDEAAPQLLERLFRRGAALLLQNLPRVWSGDAARAAVPQDEARATHAAKISKEESRLDFSCSAAALHNKVRAFAGWPGTFATFAATGGGSSSGSSGSSSSEAQQPQELQVKVLQSRVLAVDEAAALAPDAAPGEVVWAAGGSRLLVVCGGGGVLEVLQLQPPTKKSMPPKAFYNGLAGRRLAVAVQPQQRSAGAQAAV